MEIFKNIATVVGCVSGCLGLIILIVKPIRQRIVDGITKKTKETEATEKLNIITGNVTEIKKDVSQVKDVVDSLDIRVDNMECTVLDNECDRLKAELARYAAICRRGDPVYESDYLHIQEVYEKYHDKLKSNHTGTDNFQTIKKYFESQDSNRNKA